MKRRLKMKGRGGVRSKERGVEKNEKENRE